MEGRDREQRKMEEWMMKRMRVWRRGKREEALHTVSKSEERWTGG